MTVSLGGTSTFPRSNKRLTGRLLLVVFVAALGVRVGWGVLQLARASDPLALEFPDEVDYWSLAESLARGDGLVGEHGFRALRMPLFPWLLSVFASSDSGVVYAKAAQWPIGALAAVFVALLGARIGGRPIGLLAGLLVAFDPFLIFFSSLLLTETLFITALSGLWLAGWDRPRGDKPFGYPRWLLLGLLCSLCIYLRESSVGLCVVWTALVIARRKMNRRTLVGGGLAIVVMFVALLPWALRNAHLTGRMCWLTNRGGISLYDGVGPQATGASDLGRIKQMPAVRDLDEVAWNGYFLDRALKSIKADPARIARLAVVKIGRTWNPLPNVDTYQSDFVRLISASWTVPVYVLAIVGVARLRRDAASVVGLMLPAVVVLVLHAIFVGSVRYRLAAMPMLEILAAIGTTALVTRRRASPGRESGRRPVP